MTGNLNFLDIRRKDCFFKESVISFISFSVKFDSVTETAEDGFVSFFERSLSVLLSP